MHLYAYLGVGLAIPHQLWTGADFTSSPGRQVFWWTAWAACAGSVLVWRVGLPVWRNLRHDLRVAAVVPEGAGTVSVHVTGRACTGCRSRPASSSPGASSDAPGRSARQPVLPLRGPRRAVAADHRAGRRRRQRRRGRPHVGSRVWVEGPYGRLSPRVPATGKVLLIGAGVGITPLRALAEGLDVRPGRRGRSSTAGPTDPIFVDELIALARHRGLVAWGIPGRRRAPDSWLGSGVEAPTDLAALTSWVPDVAERDVYVCGPGPWADLVVRDLRAAGVPEQHIHVENFGW